MKRALLGMLVVFGCSSSVAPLTGDVYVLRSIAGVSVPAPFAQNPAVSQRILADTIAFVTETSGERRTVYEGRADIERLSFTYTRVGSRVEINFRCNDTGSCIAGPHIVGDLTSSDFVSSVTKITRGPLIYARLYPLD